MNNRYPMKGMMDQAAARGRNGDSMLMHVNPIEVNGIAALSPGGLTTNPDTGLPEASNWLKTLVPMLASYGGAAALTAATGGAAAPFLVAMAGGLSSGLATGAMTGDWERGLASGVMGAGIGGAVGSIGADAVANAATDAAATTITGGVIDPAITSAVPVGDMSQALTTGAEAGSLLPVDTNAMVSAADIGLTGTDIGIPGSAGDLASTASATDSSLGGLSEFDISNLTAKSYGDALKAPLQKDSGFGGALMKQESLMPIAIGGAAMMEQDANDGGVSRKANKNRGREAYNNEDNMRQGYNMAQGNLNKGINALDNYGYDFDSWRKRGKAEGGIVTMGDGGKVGDPVPGLSNAGKQHARDVQLGLRGKYKVQPPVGFRPGIDGEFDYFQNDPDNVEAPKKYTQEDWLNAYPPFQRMADLERDAAIKDQFKQPDGTPIYGPPAPTDTPEPVSGFDVGEPIIIDPNTGKPIVRRPPVDDMGPRDPRHSQYAEGGDVMLNTDLGQEPIAAGGIAGIETPYTQPPAAPPQQQAQPSQEDIQMVAAAITGQAGEQSDQIINMFIQQFGTDVFQQVREMILQSMQPNAQTEGMIKGQGGGMDDQVMGTIAGQEPVAVSPGEYIVPADVVSGLGDGSSDAGSAELDKMMERTRMARGGTTTQPPPFDARKVMPR